MEKTNITRLIEHDFYIDHINIDGFLYRAMGVLYTPAEPVIALELAAELAVYYNKGLAEDTAGRAVQRSVQLPEPRLEVRRLPDPPGFRLG